MLLVSNEYFFLNDIKIITDVFNILREKWFKFTKLLLYKKIFHGNNKLKIEVVFKLHKNKIRLN